MATRNGPPLHRLLAELQTVLEAGCYAFACRKMSEVLQKNGWHCVEDVGLNRWTGLLRNSSVIRPRMPKGHLNVLLLSIANIRHTAVHRRQISTRSLDNFFGNAVTLLLLLGEDRRIAMISALRSSVHPPLPPLA